MTAKRFAGQRRVDARRLLDLLGIPYHARCGELHARCPFHDDRKPSWSINENGAHHCFSCGAGGGPVDLVVRVLDLTSQGARAWLDERATVAAEPALEVVVEEPELVRAAFVLPPEVVVEPLARWPEPARCYLTHGRRGPAYASGDGITVARAGLFGVGYAVHGRLRGRVVLPARDARGRVGGYTARGFAGQRLRYLSARSEERPSPGAMFGEHLWPPHPSERAVVVVVEAALNALAVDRACPGLPVAAIGGSSPAPEQALKLATWRRVVLLTDPDAAGDVAAARLLSRVVETVRVRLPCGEDADSVAPAALRAALEPHLWSS